LDPLISDSFAIESRILGEEREICVYLPQGCKESGEIYPVIYLLDGHSLHNVVSSFVQHYSGRERIPPLIVVSIASTDRMRDFTPTIRAGSRGGHPAGGGADNFLAFLAEELFPAVEARYPTRDYRILIGHSLGGLLTVHAIVARPEFFRAYLACSPWFGEDDDALISEVESHLREGPPESKLLYLAYEPIGREGIEERIDKLVEVLKRNGREDFEWDYKRYEDADHSNLPLKAIPDALDFFFPGIVQDR
jgi:predicted alpha/beta superfamily hydrolase